MPDGCAVVDGVTDVTALRRLAHDAAAVSQRHAGRVEGDQLQRQCDAVAASSDRGIE